MSIITNGTTVPFKMRDKDSKLSQLRIPDFARLHAMENERAARWKERNNKPPTVPKGFRLTNVAAAGHVNNVQHAPAQRPFAREYRAYDDKKVDDDPNSQAAVVTNCSVTNRQSMCPAFSSGSKFVNKVKEARAGAASCECEQIDENLNRQGTQIPVVYCTDHSANDERSVSQRAGPPSSSVLYPGAFRGPKTSSVISTQRYVARPLPRPVVESWKSSAALQNPLALIQGATMTIPDNIAGASGNQIMFSKTGRHLDGPKLGASTAPMAAANYQQIASPLSQSPSNWKNDAASGGGQPLSAHSIQIQAPTQRMTEVEKLLPQQHQSQCPETGLLRRHSANDDSAQISHGADSARRYSSPVEAAAAAQHALVRPWRESMAQGGRIEAVGTQVKSAPDISRIEGRDKVAADLRYLIERIPADSMAQDFSSLDFYQFGKTLGVGAYGKVKLGLQVLTGEKVAIKMFESNKIADPNSKRRGAREIRILKALQHPRIVRLFEVVESATRKHVIMEYASGGDLCHYVREKKRLSEGESARLFMQITDALSYCHRRGVVHRDVKLDNLLLDAVGNVKLADFGFSVTFFHGQKLKKACGSPSYAAPEIVTRKPYHPPGVDVWSLGVVLYAMVCGYFPFHGSTSQDLCRRIASGKFECPAFMSAECRDLVRRMLSVDTSRRTSLADAEQHSWCRGNRSNVVIPTPVTTRPATENRIDAELSIDSLQECRVMQVEPDLGLIKEVEKLGFRRQYISKCVGHSRHNLCSTCYWLLFMKRSSCKCPLESEPCQASVESSSNQITLKPRPPPVERPNSASLSSCTTYRRLGISDIEAT
uniref:Protein kinase domain-containing protein n=1 Tax=Cryptomonas curvata TaxID=233186 RepID=A0A7S0QW82_9CRYP|mmetsp:Transcript_5560/g.12371  ORF Transcript_5560/g.12371 Transcript_5560/m.12371 type:complete len:824 (+) Transcript_5560:85-2556(+)